MRLEDKTALVTGAGSGIGRATALLFAREGARVLALDRDEAAVSDVAEIGGSRLSNGGDIYAAANDVSDPASVETAFARAEETLGPRLDVLANVAGVGSTTTVPDTPVEVWDRVLDINARGVFLCCRAALPRMIAQGAGSIVNMGSVAGLVGLRNRAAYCASKGAVIALTRALAVDHVGDGVRVNCICPGTVDSPWTRRLLEEAGESHEALVARQPMGRLGKPEEIAEAALYLASDLSAFMTGSMIVADGGLTAA